ncbi:YbaB/EbfC family nucleoid-associated protein [Micromonospora sp. HUAS LYJ1]|uniref:YbaB/EbfC family nucleoid-associated protein n=1 Tax=Micromonospora sp. HUAS LYJ1 TaxID=3061626 RepID=UPI0026724D70|nr:YbaB/EbfC family nucleoid-associated protein [Micromonospora sp. HUAS LYJ1]WKU05341.1 YbaB/EbfC family nucleoid-associated protein [Micromonospora sp. HUAS LYJ1]
MSDNDRLEKIIEEYQSRRLSFTELQQRVQAISATATSPRREVEVTVDHAGKLTDITFTGTGYRRMAPKELSALILRTCEDARAKAVEESAELLAPLMPGHLDARTLLSGKASLDQMMPADGPCLPPFVREQLSR